MSTNDNIDNNPYQPERSLMGKLLRVTRLLERARGPYSFTPHNNPLRGQGRVLSILKMRPEMNQRELSYLLDMRQQSLSELLARLEQKGFVERRPSETDRRAITITLTDAGRKAAPDNIESSRKGDALFSCLSAEEQAQLGNYLERVAQSLEDSMPEGAARAEKCRHGYAHPHDGPGRGAWGSQHGPWREHGPRPPHPAHGPYPCPVHGRHGHDARWGRPPMEDYPDRMPSYPDDEPDNMDPEEA